MAAEILCALEEEETCKIEQLAKKLAIPTSQIEKILSGLSEKNVVQYNRQTGEIRLPWWIANLNKELEKTRPATGAIILPKNQEIKLEDVTLSNFTNTDLELLVRLKANRKEIAIRTVSSEEQIKR